MACLLAERETKLRSQEERIAQLKKMLEDANLAVAASRRNSEVQSRGGMSLSNGCVYLINLMLIFTFGQSAATATAEKWACYAATTPFAITTQNTGRHDYEVTVMDEACHAVTMLLRASQHDATERHMVMK